MSRDSGLVNPELNDMYVHAILQSDGLFTPTKNGRKYDWDTLEEMADEYNRLIKNARVYSVPRGMSRGLMSKNIFFDDPITAYGRLFTLRPPEFPLVLTSVPSFIKYITPDAQPTGFVYLDLVNSVILNTETHKLLKKYIRENPYETHPITYGSRFYSDSVTDVQSMLNDWIAALGEDEKPNNKKYNMRMHSKLINMKTKKERELLNGYLF